MIVFYFNYILLKCYKKYDKIVLEFIRKLRNNKNNFKTFKMDNLFICLILFLALAEDIFNHEIRYSFPPGHSKISIAFYRYLIYLVYKNKYLKILFITKMVF